ncbi:MAG: NfeD family protein [Bacteroidota bacterium]|nr:NfeD family protein [Bacteroidota bacterium]
MSLLGIFLLILAGIVLFLLEFLVVPGVTVAGIGGLLFMGGAVYMAFENFDTTTGLLVLAAVLVIIIISLFFALRAKTWKKISLKTEVDSKVTEVHDSGLAIGDQGTALTRLNPIGSVLINEQKLEGHSQGQLIRENTAVEVIKVAHTYVIVKSL